MKTGLFPASIAILMLAACGKGPESEESTQKSTSGGNPLTAPVDYLGAIGNAQKSAISTLDLTSLTKSVSLFHAAEDRFPKDLNELVTMKYIPKLPTAPQGTQLTYDPASGKVAIVKLPSPPPPP